MVNSIRILSLAGATAGVLAACFPDPGGDYDTFVEETAAQRAAQTTPGGDDGGGGTVIEAGPPPVEFTEGTYLAVCLPNLGFGDVSKTLRFVAKTKYTPGADGAAAKLDLKLTPLPIDLAVFDPTKAVGATLNVGDALDLTSASEFEGAISDAVINGAANPITRGADITLVDIKVGGTFSGSGLFCSNFSGKVTAPIKNGFAAECLYLPLPVGDPYEITPLKMTVGGVTYAAADFGCK